MNKSLRALCVRSFLFRGTENILIIECTSNLSTPHGGISGVHQWWGGTVLPDLPGWCNSCIKVIFRTSQPFAACSGAFPDSRHETVTQEVSHVPGKVSYVGHTVSSEGVETNDDKILKIKTWPVPCNVDEVRTFLGFTGYYRRFVKDYAKIARPLNDLLGKCPKKRRKGGPRKPSTSDTWK